MIHRIFITHILLFLLMILLPLSFPLSLSIAPSALLSAPPQPPTSVSQVVGTPVSYIVLPVNNTDKSVPEADV